MTKRAFLSCFAAFASASIALAVHAAPTYTSVLIKDVPHVKQNPDFCGEACVEMALGHLGWQVDQDEVFNISGLDPAHGRGCHTRELTTALKRIGFETGPVYYTVPSKRSEAPLNLLFERMHADLKKGIPSIICMRYDARPKTTEHFRLILGYDARTDEVIFHEPAVEKGAYKRMKRNMLIRLWPLKYDARKWTVIRMALKPKKLNEIAAARGRYTPADYAQHVMELKKKLPGKGFSIVVKPPFVVVGDEAPAMVKRRAEKTVKWAVDKLKKKYFKKDPTAIIDIWLFKNKKSYETNTFKLFHERPSTPYGYYSDEYKALVMNIATGGGTLVHEIVHPFIDANFPDCPAWFNEGLASLYEQCNERKGRIVGMTNWRLAGLQGAIRRKKVPAFTYLTSTTAHRFYQMDSGTNYSQARYLCYYLQEKGLLAKYYKAFHKNAKKDPGGFETLKEVLGEKDMKAFKEKWEAFILKLRFP